MGQGSRAGVKPSVGMWRCKIRSGEMGNQEWGDVNSGVWGSKIRSGEM